MKKFTELSPLSTQQLEASLNHTLRAWDQQSPISVFAYGSLIWNPEIEYDLKQSAIVHGYHRSLCLWSRVYRGTLERPGLVLGLDYGGCCQGVIYRIPAPLARSELMKIWRRELITGAYQPRWLKTRSIQASAPSSTIPIPAISFVINRAGPAYAGKLDHATLLETLSSAHGQRGSNQEYLKATVVSLSDHGIRDSHLITLAKKINAI